MKFFHNFVNNLVHSSLVSINLDVHIHTTYNPIITMALPDHDQKRPNVLEVAYAVYEATRREKAAVYTKSGINNTDIIEHCALYEAARVLTPQRLRDQGFTIDLEIARVVIESQKHRS